MIFIVDDDHSVRTSLMRLMRSAGYEARAFADAETYLNDAGGERTWGNCVILDLQMPGMSGLDLQQFINRLEPPVPVIVLTASEDAELRARALAAGCAKVLRKPCDGMVLISAIAEATGEPPRFGSRPAPRETPNERASTPPARTEAGGMSEFHKVDGFVLENGRAFHRPVGWVSFDEAVALVREGIATARKQEVRDLLVDTTALTGFSSPDTFQRFLAAVEWADEAKSSLRLAMVAREEMIDPQRFGVIVARNRGLVSNIFTTEQAARDWLGGTGADAG